LKLDERAVGRLAARRSPSTIIDGPIEAVRRRDRRGGGSPISPSTIIDGPIEALSAILPATASSRSPSTIIDGPIEAQRTGALPAAPLRLSVDDHRRPH